MVVMKQPTFKALCFRAFKDRLSHEGSLSLHFISRMMGMRPNIRGPAHHVQTIRQPPVRPQELIDKLN